MVYTCHILVIFNGYDLPQPPSFAMTSANNTTTMTSANNAMTSANNATAKRIVGWNRE